uniref:Family with sequence similarity 120 member A n=1 Tax=Cyprinus carpio carpio TaxID=630221 RepID=A0A9J7YGQ5_CYPCA
MGVQGFQEYIEKHCPNAVVPVELQKLARGSLVGGGRQRPPQTPLRLLVDAENCLHRLYGGFYTDWVSGGQWNHMLGYLAALAKACFNGNIELLVCFNGALEKGRLHEWVKRQVNERQTAQQIISHVQNKGTPPPKVWFLPPVCMAHCIRLALLRFHIGVVQTIEDHHQEVIALFRENGFHGLVAYDSDYALCNIPYYFSAHALKLSRNGKSLTTSQYLMHEVAKQLNLNPNRFVIFASLLGNHILPDEDLAAFHWSLLGPEHPLASLKVRAHQLVLPPCDVVIRAVADYVRNLQDVHDLEAIAKDIFKFFFYICMPTVRPNQMGLPAALQMLNIPGKPGVSTISPLWSILNDSRLPIRLTHTCFCSSSQHGYPGPPLAEPVHEADPSAKGLLEQNSYSNIPNDGKQHTPLYERLSPINSAHGSNSNHTDPAFFITSSTSSMYVGYSDPSVTSPVNQSLEGKGHVGVNAQIPSLLSMPTRNHMDITTPPLPVVAAEVLRVAEHRHKKGLMYPYIYHVLTKGEIKLSVTIEDEANKDLPSAVQLYRPVRQYVYGVLFSLAEAKKKAERLAMRRNHLPDYPTVIIKEWAAYKGKSPHTPELVEALPFREWTCPNLKKLWLGKAVEDKNRRMRAFLACMRSDTPAMLNPANVSTPLMVLCCVLRFMLQWPGVRILRRNELDAFLAQALSPKLYEPDQLQDLKIDNLDPRGVQLAALFMSGVDMALFANDVCGQPIPWEHCCPWMYFDGKLLQSKLIRASRNKAPLIDLCDGQTELVAKVEKMRQSILEGLNFSRPPQQFAFPPPPPHAMPFYPPNSTFYPPPPPPPLQGIGRGMPVGLQAIPSQGGKLEIAGTVVGQWAGSRRGRGRASFPIQLVSVGGPTRGHPRGVISTPVIRTFGRGTKYHTRGFKSQGTYQSKPAYVASTNEVIKDRKKLKLVTPHLPLEGSTAEENGLVEVKEADQLNGNEGESMATNQPESAFSNESKMCNTNPLLNALNEDGEGCRDEALGAAVLKTEE